MTSVRVFFEQTSYDECRTSVRDVYKINGTEFFTVPCAFQV